MGKPTYEDSFNLYKVGDINVYVLKWLRTRDEEIRITLSRFLWTKYLYVDGISF
ncbi:MAG: hypothetical protein GX077_01120 [Tissierellia bacterium]|nr:hypothetical protein [Tissierellia bacterium]